MCDVRLRCQVDAARFVVTRGRFGRDVAVNNRATTYIRNPRFHMIGNKTTIALLPFNDVVDLEDCWLRLDTHLLQDRHELRAEGIKLGLTLKDVYHL